MLQISRRFTPATPAATVAPLADLKLVLPFEIRSRSRFRARLADGQEVGVIIDRGQILRGGDHLQADDGRIVIVQAAAETVSTVRTTDARELARAAYHLGNRHVALQVGADWLRYQHDHVLDDMVRGLGLTLIIEQAPFEPEAGAYHGEEISHRHGPAQDHHHEHR